MSDFSRSVVGAVELGESGGCAGHGEGCWERIGCLQRTVGETGWYECGGMRGGVENTCAKWRRVPVGRAMQRGEIVRCPGKS